MNTRFLATLCAIAEAGSLAGAARALGLASATVAEQVQALERELGVRLVGRQGRAVTLTDEGRAVVAAGRDILARVADLAQVAQLGRLRGGLRVGAVSTALISILPPALKLMAERSPEIALHIAPGTSSQLARMLEAGEIDCALTVQPRFALAKGWGWLPVRREPLTLVSPVGLRRDTTDAYLSAAPLIRMDRRSPTGAIVTDYLNSRRIVPNELFELDAPDTITILVSLGLGIALLPDYGFRSSDDRPIRKIPIADRAFVRSIGILHRRGARIALIDALHAALCDSCARPG
ncbi:transcriptional regulator, LysR family [Methylobacterium sp. 4-46]|uniref:LysR substrate-binding domain-containing protein n=1 Tax=unclassified Methylobacterium TaxID=2615210 RepID=UPI000165C657|nr:MULTISPECIES: LysR substrate-binding domain-containing protein [Methylobacterium]ACA17704.1 transcriptional regulator, LysR family [Methylobacterium sp. 4-46]WFT83373.1 LysR substrate-binding domain-containing protein [Methylobacterium nodulans]